MPQSKIREPDFDPALFDIRHVIDIGLGAKALTMPSYTPKGWRSSSLGYCMRRQFLERAGVPKPDDGFRASRTLWLGDIIHGAVQALFRQSGLLIREELALEDEDLHIQGHVDMVWGGLVPDTNDEELEGYSPKWVAYLTTFREQLREKYDANGFPITGTELKSAAQYSAEKMQSEGPAFHHLMQTASYALMLNRHPELLECEVDRWQIAVMGKTDLKMVTFPIADKHVEQVEERLIHLNDYWQRRELPPCRCGIDISWERNYCAYQGLGDCCGEDLILDATSKEFWDGVSDEGTDDDAPAMGTMVGE